MHVFMPYTNNMSKSSKCARISQTLQMDTWKPSSTNKRIMSTQPREKKREVRTYSPKFPHTLIRLLISQILEHPCHIPALNLPSEKPSSCRILCVAWECRYLLLPNPGISFGTMWQDLRHLGTAALSVWSLQNVSMQCMIELQPSLQRLHRRGGKEQYHCTILKLPDTIAGASILCGDCSPLWYLASSGNLEEKTQGGSGSGIGWMFLHSTKLRIPASSHSLTGKLENHEQILLHRSRLKLINLMRHRPRRSLFGT